jgi:hypothetical protein
VKLLVTQNTYKQTNASLTVSDDMRSVQAYSYGWWRFVDTDAAGNVVFNSYRYSVSTGGHQRDVESILDRLGIRVDLWLSRTRRSLCGHSRAAFRGEGNPDGHGIRDAISDEIGFIRAEIQDLRDAIAARGSRKAKNAERAAEITRLEYRIADLTRWRDEYVDKQRLPAVAGTPQWGHCRRSDWSSYEQYFRKPNGVVNVNGLKAFADTVMHSFAAPESIDTVKALLGLKAQPQIETVLRYRFAGDLNTQIPEVDSAEYVALKAWAERAGITATSLTTLALDKLHTYLTNRQNRRTYEPREPEQFPVAEPVRQLAAVEGVELLDTDRKLRAEGRRQHHCIGGAHYLNRCRQGYHALNYKGFTFFLNPRGEILETHGRFNSPTPTSVMLELSAMLRQEHVAA